MVNDKGKHMNLINKGCIGIIAALLLQGCGMFGGSNHDTVGDHDGRSAQHKPVKQIGDPVSPMVLRVVGYGAVNPKSKLSKVQKRLMAMRASRLDAYRNMAERVYGASIEGNSTVRDLVVLNDQFKTYVETHIHGARVVSSHVLDDSSVETTLEMVIDEGFRNCLTTQTDARFNSTCRASFVNDLHAYRENIDRNAKGDKTVAAKENSQLYFVD
jgi:hypothetical protein